MHSITYLSAAKTLFSESHLWKLLKKSRDYNYAHGITGMLLYNSGSFIQTIEGPEMEVRELYRKICDDPSHGGIIKVFDEEIMERAFPEWSMGFVTSHVFDSSGYSDFLTNDNNLDDFWERPHEAKHLLYNFRNAIR